MKRMLHNSNRLGHTALLLTIILAACKTHNTQSNINSASAELHRPALHFTPASGWMNDPNGMVFYNGVYHLFFQHYPDSNVWGPMHWGHATSTDLVNWSEQAIALFPDSLGYIFSGSVVVDSMNSTGFAANGQTALVAIFTHHNMAGEKRGDSTFQYQSLAYSVDDGKTWKKYEGNPVLANPGIRDFRDPKVIWHAPTRKWIMVLAVKDRVHFYASSNLKQWEKLSEFGANAGAHGGVWECPDLISFSENGKTVWTLLVSINPGGPNGGSATQYFAGSFDGKEFTASHSDVRWIDHGPDNYAGVTFSNTGTENIFMGWMSNWLYAQKVPTVTWRSAMTLARKLALVEIDGQYFIRSTPIVGQRLAEAIQVNAGEPVGISLPMQIELSGDSISSFQIELKNNENEYWLAGYDEATNQYYVDRRGTGNSDFDSAFAMRHVAPRISRSQRFSATLIIDVASAELFADSGLSVLTQTFFPSTSFNVLTLNAPAGTLKSMVVKKAN